jgi:hypothetical protein
MKVFEVHVVCSSLKHMECRTSLNHCTGNKCATPLQTLKEEHASLQNLPSGVDLLRAEFTSDIRTRPYKRSGGSDLENSRYDCAATPCILAYVVQSVIMDICTLLYR